MSANKKKTNIGPYPDPQSHESTPHPYLRFIELHFDVIPPSTPRSSSAIFSFPINILIVFIVPPMRATSLLHLSFPVR